MPAYDAWSRRHKVLYWAFLGYGDDGMPTHSAPTDLRVMWDDTPRLVKGATGTTIAIDATATLGEDVDVHSLMWFAPDQTPESDSAEDQWYANGSGNNARVMEVAVFDNKPDARSRQFKRIAKLVYHKGKPT